MIWPFKKVDKVSFDDYVAALAPAPCGNQREHYFWTDLEKGRCPVCSRMAREKKEQEDQDRMARLIAKRVVELLKENARAGEAS